MWSFAPVAASQASRRFSRAHPFLEPARCRPFSPQLEPFPDGSPVGWAPVLPSSAGAPWPPCRYGHTTGVLGGALFVFGGMTFPGCGAGGGPTPSALADLWSFDVLAGAWTEVAQGQPAPGPLGVPAGIVVGASFYVYGGAAEDSGFPELWRWRLPPFAPPPPPPQCAASGPAPATVVALAVSNALTLAALLGGGAWWWWRAQRGKRAAAAGGAPADPAAIGAAYYSRIDA